MTTQPRPRSLPGTTSMYETNLGKFYITVNAKDGVPFEVFGALGHSDVEQRSEIEGICRLVSLLLRRECPVEEIVKQLDGIESRSVWFEGTRIKSMCDAVAKELAKYMEDHNDG